MWPFSRRKKRPAKPTSQSPNPFEDPPPSRGPEEGLVIGLARAKLGALYFSHTLPLIFDPGEYLNDPAERANSASAGEPVDGPALVESLLVPGLWTAISSSFRTMKEWAVVQETIRCWQEYEQTGRLPEIGEAGGIEMATAYWMSDPATAPIRAARYLLGMVGLESSPVLLSEKMLTATHVGDVRINLMNVELIDPAHLSWRRILDLRKDRSAIEALQQVPRVIFEDAGQTRQESEDRFTSVWQQHHAVCERYGIARRTGQIPILCGWASPMAVTAAANIAILGGSAAPDDLTKLTDHTAQIGSASVSMFTHHLFGESRNLVYYLMDVEGRTS